MIISNASKVKKIIVFAVILASGLFSYGFSRLMGEQEWLTWSNKCFSESFDPTGEDKLKKWEITLTEDHFLRFRKTYQQGKQEYYSFNLQRFNQMDYRDSASVNVLQLKTIADDIIFQTYNDPQGNLDSMANMLTIPVKKMTKGRVDSLHEALNYLKQRSL